MIKINGVKIELGHYPDGSLLLRNYYESINISGNNQVLWCYDGDDEMFALTCIIRKIQQKTKDIQGTKLSLIIPYLPNARMDREKNNEDIFTLKYFSEFLNNLKLDCIYVSDVHSNASINLINNFINETYYVEHIEQLKKELKIDLLCYPDLGATKKYSNVLSFDYCFANKKRDWNTGQILGLNLFGPDVKDKIILIVDDIIAYGGSIYYTSKKLKELGAKEIYVYVSHTENSILDEEKGILINSGLINHIYTTDSIFTEEHPLISKMINWRQ